MQIDKCKMQNAEFDFCVPRVVIEDRSVAFLCELCVSVVKSFRRDHRWKMGTLLPGIWRMMQAMAVPYSGQMESAQ